MFKKVECKIVSYGNSMVIVIPSTICEMLNVGVGDRILVPFHEFEKGNQLPLPDEDDRNPHHFRGLLGSQPFDITRDDVNNAMNILITEPHAHARNYYIEHEGVKLPTKEIISKATKIPKNKFNSLHANAILLRMGFKFETKHGGNKLE